MNDATGYSRLSIILHWLGALAVIVLFLTHEGDRGSLRNIIHVSGGALVGALLLWRVFRRVRRGMTVKPAQHFLYNLASSIVIYGFLVAIVVVVITGYLLPWSIGQPIEIFSWVSIPSPISPIPTLHELFEETHEIAGKIFVPLLALHIVGALKHRFIDRDDILQRMFKSIPRGR